MIFLPMKWVLVELVDGQGAFGAGLGLFGQFGEQGFNVFM